MPVYHGLYLGMNANPTQGIEDISATQKYPLGTFFDDEDGRRFRYALNGGVALVAGDLVQNSATTAGALTTLQTVAFIGRQTAAGLVNIPVASLTTSQVADVFAEGWAAFEDTSAVATYLRRIKSNTALTHTTWADTPMEIVLYEGLPIQLETTDFVALMANPYKNIIVAPATSGVTGMVLGGVCCPVTLAYYCWVQTRGWFGCHIKDGALVAGPVVVGGTTAGTPATHNAEFQTVGVAPAAWADEAAGIIWLNCE